MSDEKKESKVKDDSKLLAGIEKIIDQQQAKIRVALDKLKYVISQESAETKEMLEIYSRYVSGSSAPGEMDKANEQMRDLLRVAGLGFLAVLPLAPMSIPLVVKIGEKLGVQVLPSSFQKKS